jgi:hypothetical protein
VLPTLAPASTRCTRTARLGGTGDHFKTKPRGENVEQRDSQAMADGRAGLARLEKKRQQVEAEIAAVERWIIELRTRQLMAPSSRSGPRA